MSSPRPLDVSSASDPTIAVAIATKGRPAILAETLASLAKQTHPPAAILVVVSAPEDAPLDLPASIQVLVGPTGSTFQRNWALKHMPPGIDYIAYFDDDMELRSDYLEKAIQFLRRHPNVAAFSGFMVADGKVTRDQAQRLVQDYQAPQTNEDVFITSGRFHTLHGCNMVIRRALQEHEIFDENLPLYAFGEDYDISLRLKSYGPVGRYSGCVGAHLQASGGRVHEEQRGYSLVANNWYFLKKRISHLPRPLAVIRFWLVCVGVTLLRCWWNYLKGDRSINWMGRAKGCRRALRDIMRGTCEPSRILEFKDVT